MQKARLKKVVKYRWWPRNGCDGKLVAKVLMTILVLIPSEAWMRQDKLT